MARVMVLSGCASGIGLHLASALVARGNKIVATDIDLAALEPRAREAGWSEEQVRLRKLDVRRADDWDEALDLAISTWGGLDVVMNVAGVIRPGFVQGISPADIDLHMDVNVKGTMLGTRAAAARMIPRGAGHIINFGSLASLAPVPGLALYSASKFAVRGFSLAAATELRAHGIAVTLVMPDAVQTPMLDQQVDHDEAALTFSGPRALEVEEIGRLVLDDVLRRRPMEVTIPLVRGALARIANSAPEVSRVLSPLLTRKGLTRQSELRKQSGGSRKD